MMLKDMLVYLDCQTNLERLVMMLPQLMQDKGTHALGFHVVHEVSLPLYATEIQVTSELLDQSEKMMMDRAAHIEKKWNIWGKEHQANVSFKSKKVKWMDGLVSASKYVDCVVMGNRVVVDGHGEEELTHIPSQVFFKIFRPLLVVPTQKPTKNHAGAEFKGFSKVMISWNESKQAFRTVDHAMPILRHAGEVFIVIREAKKSLLDSSERDESTEESAGEKLVQYLKARGVKNAKTCFLADDGRSISQGLLEFATTQKIDLIVMGAYGHSAFREKLLGGTTEYILHHADIPVFLSH